MSDRWRTEVATGLRALASPPAACCLVVWLLNDHVLKEAWPSWVTGKLSDLTGLVVAPLLVGTLLALLGVRRALGWGVTSVCAGFVAVKASATGAGLVSSAWGFTGFPTTMLADPTDLLALPAVLVTVGLWRRARRDPGVPRLRLVAGMLLLPVGVLTTAATSCDPYEGVSSLTLVESKRPGSPAQRLLLVDDDHRPLLVDAAGTVRAAGAGGGRPVTTYGAQVTRACAADGQRCWRLADAGTVEGSADGGRTWTAELSLDEAARQQALAGHEEQCGEVPSADLTSLQVVEHEGRVLVVVAAGHGGLWLGGPDRPWDRADGPLEAAPAAPGRSRVRPLDPRPPHAPLDVDDAGPTTPRSSPPPAPPAPSCPPDQRRTITPHPSNGPPIASCP